MEQIQADGKMMNVIHLTYSVDESRKDGSWRIACQPNRTELHATQIHPAAQRTDDPRAVTCPACKRTQKFAHLKSKTDALR